MLCNGSWKTSMQAVLKQSIQAGGLRLHGASPGSLDICCGSGEQENEREKMRAVSLLYHDVVPPGESESSGFPGGDSAIYKIELSDFEEHIRALASIIDRPTKVSELCALHDPSTLLTFDDGGSSAHTFIADMLDKRGWHGHFFVTTNWVGQRGFLNQRQIRDLHS